MNEKRVREVIEIERQAQYLLATASSEAERLPIEAEAEAREMLDKARGAAREEARKIVEQAEAGNEASEAILRAQERMGETDRRAAMNLEKAVAYVVQQVVGGA